MTAVSREHRHLQHRVTSARRREGDPGKYLQLTVEAGHRGTERIVPPAGEAHAFERDLWARRVEVSISPSGRSVRVWVDGVEVPRR